MLSGVMNNTKWDEVRLAMHAIDPRPSWRTLDLNGYCAPSDKDWFYHFRNGRYESIQHLDICLANPAQREAVRSALREVHVPGEETPEGFRIFGYVENGLAIDFL